MACNDLICVRAAYSRGQFKTIGSFKVKPTNAFINLGLITARALRFIVKYHIRVQ